MIADNGTRRAGLFRSGFDVLERAMLIGRFQERQMDQSHLLMTQTLSSWRQVGSANPQNDQALGFSDLHREIDEPHPIVRPLFAPKQFSQANTQQPPTPGCPRDFRQIDPEVGADLRHDTRGCPQRDTSLYRQVQKENNQDERMLLPDGFLLP
jgi:hypothetical protein